MIKQYAIIYNYARWQKKRIKLFAHRYEASQFLFDFNGLVYAQWEVYTTVNKEEIKDVYK